MNKRDWNTKVGLREGITPQDLEENSRFDGCWFWAQVVDLEKPERQKVIASLSTSTVLNLRPDRGSIENSSFILLATPASEVIGTLTADESGYILRRLQEGVEFTAVLMALRTEGRHVVPEIAILEER